jgi:hypothetical protein
MIAENYKRELVVAHGKRSAPPVCTRMVYPLDLCSCTRERRGTGTNNARSEEEKFFFRNGGKSFARIY